MIVETALTDRYRALLDKPPENRNVALGIEFCSVMWMDARGGISEIGILGGDRGRGSRRIQ